MGIWNLGKVVSAIGELNIADARESANLAGWVWEEIMHFSTGDEIRLSHADEEKILHSIQRIASGEPVQYIAGHAWFYGMKLKVTPDVLIPRPETEELVSWILEDLKTMPKKEIRILDIGTGSGCIAIALKKHLKTMASVFAIDISKRALRIAIANADQSGLEIAFIERDFLMDDLGDLGHFDVIVSNPPYVSNQFAGEMKINQLRFEPPVALYPVGDDPDIFYRRIAKRVGKLALPGATVYLEINEFRSEEIRGYFTDASWREMTIRKDLQGAERMLRLRI